MDMIVEICKYNPIVGLIGSLLIFFFGIPAKTNQDAIIGIESASSPDKTELQNIRRYKRYGKIGIILIALSFLMQILLIPDPF